MKTLKKKADQTKLQRYKERIEKLEERLYNEKLEEHRKFDNLGWGAGIRRSKISISYSKSERTKRPIKKLQVQIQTLLNN